MSKEFPAPSQPSFPKRLALAGLNILIPLIVGFILAYYVIREVSQTKLWFIQMLHYILPWLFIPLILLLPAAILLRSRMKTLLLILPPVPLSPDLWRTLPAALTCSHIRHQHDCHDLQRMGRQRSI